MGNGSDREEQKRGQRKQEERKREIVQTNNEMIQILNTEHTSQWRGREREGEGGKGWDVGREIGEVRGME